MPDPREMSDAEKALLDELQRHMARGTPGSAELEDLPKGWNPSWPAPPSQREMKEKYEMVDVPNEGPPFSGKPTPHPVNEGLEDVPALKVNNPLRKRFSPPSATPEKPEGWDEAEAEWKRALALKGQLEPKPNPSQAAPEAPAGRVDIGEPTIVQAKQPRITETSPMGWPDEPYAEGGPLEPTITKRVPMDAAKPVAPVKPPVAPSKSSVSVSIGEPTLFQRTPMSPAGSKLTEKDAEAPSVADLKGMPSKLPSYNEEGLASVPASPAPPVPQGYADRMREALREDERRAGMEQFGRGLQTATTMPHNLEDFAISRAGGHISPDQKLQNPFAATGPSAVERFGKMSAAEEMDEMKNPESATSKAFREILSGALPPEKLAGMNAETMAKAAPWGLSIAQAKAKQAQAEATLAEKKARDAQAAEDKRHSFKIQEEGLEIRKKAANAAMANALANQGIRQQLAADARDAKGQQAILRVGPKLEGLPEALNAVGDAKKVLEEGVDKSSAEQAIQMMASQGINDALMAEMNPQLKKFTENIKRAAAARMHKAIGSAMTAQEMGEFFSRYGVTGSMDSMVRGLDNLEKDITTEQDSILQTLSPETRHKLLSDYGYNLGGSRSGKKMAPGPGYKLGTLEDGRHGYIKDLGNGEIDFMPEEDDDDENQG